MFTVIIPLFNKEESILKTVQSVLRQTFADFELIVVNDGSTDNSRNIVASLNDSRIQIVDKPNGGVSSTRNEGIKAARFDYIAFLDADDLWEPDFLETIRGLILDYPEAGGYSTAYACTVKGEVLNVFGAKTRGIVVDFFKKVYEAPIMHSSSSCIKRDSFEKAGFFNIAIRRGEDYDMWGRLGRVVKIAATPEIRALYRLDGENRAMFNLPEPETVWLYYVPREAAYDRDQKRYYKRFIHRQVLEYLIKGRFAWAWKIAARNWEIASWYSYFLLPGSIQSRQFKSWWKLFKRRLG